jgi:hypothetical protein
MVFNHSNPRRKYTVYANASVLIWNRLHAVGLWLIWYIHIFVGVVRKAIYANSRMSVRFPAELIIGKSRNSRNLCKLWYLSTREYSVNHIARLSFQRLRRTGSCQHIKPTHRTRPLQSQTTFTDLSRTRK